MINRTKIASLAVCAILSAAVLTGASSSTASSAAPAASSQAASSVVSSAAAEENGASDLDGIYNALLQADPISNQFEIAAMNIEYDFGLQAEDVVSYKGVKSNDNGDAGLVLVIEAADGKAEDIANQLTAYQQDQVAFYGTLSSLRHRPMWRTLSSPSRTTAWSWPSLPTSALPIWTAPWTAH